MNRLNRKPNIYILLLFTVVIMDLVSTYYASPDLKYESNWFVTRLGFGWIGMIIGTLSITVIFLLLYLYHAYYFQYQFSFIQSKRVMDYILIYLFNRLNNPYKLRRRNFKDVLMSLICAFINYEGFVHIRLAVASKSVLTFNNWALGYALHNGEVIVDNKSVAVKFLNSQGSWLGGISKAYLESDGYFTGKFVADFTIYCYYAITVWFVVYEYNRILTRIKALYVGKQSFVLSTQKQ